MIINKLTKICHGQWSLDDIARRAVYFPTLTECTFECDFGIIHVKEELYDAFLKAIFALPEEDRKKLNISFEESRPDVAFTPPFNYERFRYDNVTKGVVKF